MWACRRASILSASIACWFAGVAGAGSGAVQIPAVVAIVNGKKVPGAVLARRVAQSRSMNPERFDRMTGEEKRRGMVRVLRALVTQETEYQEALRQHIVIPEEQIEGLLERERRRFPASRDFEKSLADGQITVAEWKQEMRKALAIAKLEERMAARTEESGRAGWLRAWRSELISRTRIWTWEP